MKPRRPIKVQTRLTRKTGRILRKTRGGYKARTRVRVNSARWKAVPRSIRRQIHI